MIISYIKIALRYLLKHKFYTIVNVLGLALGLSTFLLLMAYVTFEKRYDKHFSKSPQIYRLTTDQVINGEITVRDAMSFYPSGKVLKEELPEVLQYTTSFKFETLVFRAKNDQLREESSVLSADHHFFSIFDYKVLHGNTNRLSEPYQLVLTQSKAIEYFGKTNVVDASIFIHSEFEQEFNIAAVIEDLPENTHYKFSILLSNPSIKERTESQPWGNYSYYTYLLLKQGVNLEARKPLLAKLAKKHIGEHTNLTFNLQPIEAIHLHSNFTYEPEIHGNAQSVKILSIIAWFILIVAWINYINLATAKAMNRSKEIGLRKVIGAKRFQLIIQFFTEAFLVNFLATIVAYVFVIFMASRFNTLVGKQILTDVWSNVQLIQYLLVFFVFGAFVSGCYPALLMSGFRPIKALKGKFRNATQGILVRKGLVGFQFATAFILISSTLTVILQVKHMAKIDKGMRTDQVIGLRLPPQPVEDWTSALHRLEKFSEQLKPNGNTPSMAVITNLPGGGSADINASGGMQVIGLSDYNEAIFYSLGIDENVIPLLEMKLLYGRNFRKGFASDKDAVIVNESFLKKLGLNSTNEVIGKKMRSGKNTTNKQYTIIGVVKDAQRTSSKHAVEPTIYYNDWGYGGGHGYGYMMLKLNPDTVGKTLDQIRNTWLTFFPNEVFTYQFLDERFAQLYQKERQFGSLFGVFSVLAIVITILGLFGLTSFMASQRTKEVGIRKVLGASLQQIVLLFYTETVRLISVSTVIGIPIVWFMMWKWLGDYATKISFPWWTLVVAITLLFILAFLTILSKTIKVAQMNPTVSLRQ